MDGSSPCENLKLKTFNSNAGWKIETGSSCHFCETYLPDTFENIKFGFTGKMTTASDEPMVPIVEQRGNIDDFLTLADLAGIKGPGNTMRIVLELICIGVPPQEAYQLLRDVLASKSRTKRERSGTKPSSRRSHPSVVSNDPVQENTAHLL